MLFPPSPSLAFVIALLIITKIAQSLPSNVFSESSANGIYFSSDDRPVTYASSPFSTPTNSNLSTRATVDPGIYICSGLKWSGTCFWQLFPPRMYGKCGAVTANAGLGSIGPDKGIEITLYKAISCTPSGQLKNGIIWAGITDLKAEGIATGPNFGIVAQPYTGSQYQGALTG